MAENNKKSLKQAFDDFMGDAADTFEEVRAEGERRGEKSRSLGNAFKGNMAVAFGKAGELNRQARGRDAREHAAAMREEDVQARAADEQAAARDAAVVAAKGNRVIQQVNADANDPAHAESLLSIKDAAPKEQPPQEELERRALMSAMVITDGAKPRGDWGKETEEAIRFGLIEPDPQRQGRHRLTDRGVALMQSNQEALKRAGYGATPHPYDPGGRHPQFPAQASPRDLSQPK